MESSVESSVLGLGVLTWVLHTFVYTVISEAPRKDLNEAGQKAERSVRKRGSAAVLLADTTHETFQRWTQYA